MKKKMFALILGLALSLLSFSAYAANADIREVEYKGFGIVQLDFTKDCDWYENAQIALKDADERELPLSIIGGEEDDCYIYCSEIADGAAYTLSFSLNDASQTIEFEALTENEYIVGGNGEIMVRTDSERCDHCGEIGHDDDYCPQGIGDVPQDPDSIARLFDIDRCERCGGIGHDDDHCTY